MTTDTTPHTSAASARRTHVAGVLALELSPASDIARDALPPADAEELARLIGQDLGTLVEGARTLDLVVAAAHFDPAEVLRPGWPLHRRLDELHQRAPRHGEDTRIVAFGADAAGTVPRPLAAEEPLRGGQLRVLPLVFAGEESMAQAVSDRMERTLLDRGMAGAQTALHAQEAFGARIEHARYLTVHDLAAMMALQYGNQGLDGLWNVVETALLRPGSTVTLDLPHEPLVHYTGGEARIALFSPDMWRERYAAQADRADASRLARRHALFEARQRMYADILRAHGVEVVFEQHGGPAQDTPPPA